MTVSSTARQLQSDSGASIEPGEGTDGAHTVVVTGSAAALGIAVPAIEELLARAENPDYEGAEGKRLRAEAQKCYDERSRCFDAKQAAFDAVTHLPANC